MTPLIYKVLSNKATAEERQLLQQWIEQSPDNREEYENIRLLWSSGRKYDEGNKSDHSTEGFEKIREAIQRRTRRKNQRRLVYILVLIIVFAFIYLITNRNSPNRLSFEDQPLSVVIESIESEYQLRIFIEDKDMKSCRFTGTFYDVELPSRMVASIADAFGAKLEVIRENEYRLVGGRCR